jgi:amino-acid N-acetyltransferase
MISGIRSDALVEPANTQIAVEVRKARMSDIAPLLELINGYAARGIMLPRTEFELSESMRDFVVAESEGRLVGCGALHFYSPTTGEVRSLAVAESAKTHGVGRRVIAAIIEEAFQYSLDAIFVFTYVPEFFSKMGFSEVERGALPLKAWKDCLRCPKFHGCDEIAMMRVLRPHHWAASTQKWGNLPSTSEGTDSVLLPIIRVE